MSIDERQELALELYRSRHGGGGATGGSASGTMTGTGTLGRRMGTLGRGKNSSSAAAAAALGKSPPRPSPASVAYHSDEESLKCYDENPDDSSVTEKHPSELSSSESQVRNQVQCIFR
jgi:protein sidekick